MIRAHLVLFGLLTGTLAACSPIVPVAAQASLYVSTTGSGTACTQTTPCASINQAYLNARPGGTILLMGGRYPAQTVNNKSGVSGSDTPITVEPVPGASVRLYSVTDQAPALIFTGFTIDSTACGDACLGTFGFYFGSQGTAVNVKLLNSHIINGTITVYSNNATISGNEIGPSPLNHDGIDVADKTSNTTITHNYIHDLTTDAANPSNVHVDCIQMWDTSKVLIEYNRLMNCVDRALLTSGGLQNITIENNFIEGCAVLPCQGSGAVIDFRWSGLASDSGLVFTGNTVQSGAILMSPNYPNLTYADNILAEVSFVDPVTHLCFSGTHNLIAAGNTDKVCSGAWLINGSVKAPLPSFRSVAADDLHVSALDATLKMADNSIPATNYDGKPRCSPTYVGADDAILGCGLPSPKPTPQRSPTPTPPPGTVIHRLSFKGLQVPQIADSMAGPVAITVGAVNGGNTPAVVQPQGTAGGQSLVFKPALVRRGTSQRIGTSWSPPLFCWCEVSVEGLNAHVLVLPARVLLAAVAVVLVLLGRAVWPRLRRRRLRGTS